MTTQIITKTLAKVNAQPTEYSLGFKRLTVLPLRVRKHFDLASNLETNFDGKKALENQKNFLADSFTKGIINMFIKMVLKEYSSSR
jgi:hypothetical protein